MGNPLAELGLSTEEGSLAIDHAIVLTVNAGKTLEDTLLHTLAALTKSSKDANRVMKVVGYAAATYLVLAGVARVIEASRSNKGDEN